MRRPPLLLLAIAFTLGACASSPRDERKAASVIPNVRRVGPTVWSGASPRGDAAFAELRGLGVRSIISVDGERPDLESAHKAGVRYVHLPIGYGPLSPERLAALVRAARELEGPVYVHCHHGQHRGPTAAAIVKLVRDGGTRDEAIAEMHAAGTGPRYVALYECVRKFETPSPEELSRVPPLCEVQPPPPLVEAMLEMDGHLERLEKGTARESDAHEALLLREGLTELLRSRSHEERAADWKSLLTSAEDSARAVESSCSGGHADRAAVARLKASCTACHEKHRDR